jgi:PAS domain S-box-containing protein
MRVRLPLWQRYVIFGLAVITAWLLLRDWVAGESALFLGLHVALVVALFVGIRRNRPPERGGWYLILLGHCSYAVGDAIWRTQPPFPSPADAFYVTSYVLLLAGLIQLVRKRRDPSDKTGIIDSLVVTLGLSVLAGVFLVKPVLLSSDLDMLSQIVSLTYPAFDLLLVGVLVHLLLTSTKHNLAYLMLSVAFLLQLVADIFYSLYILNSTFDFSHPLNAIWMMSYVFLGAAALHPAAGLRSQQIAVSRASGITRLVILGVAALIPPIVMMSEAAWSGISDLAIIAIVSGVLLILILVRVGLLMADITERQKIERALREAETKYRTLIERIPAAVYIDALDEISSNIYISPQIEVMTGWPPEEWQRRAGMWLEIMHPEDLDAVVALQRESSETGEFVAEYRVISPDGEAVWIRDEGVIVKTDEGRPLFWQGVLLDITEEKQMEQRLLQAGKMEAVGQLAGGIAHDFNNLLGIIQNYASFLVEDLGPQDVRRLDATEIVTASHKAAGLVRQLLTFSRQEVPQPVVLDINDIVIGTDRLLTRTIGAHIEMHLDLAPDLKPVKLDPSRLEQLLINLVLNACDAMDGGGTLLIATLPAPTAGSDRAPQELGDFVCLSVTDTGEGMTGDLQERIFEPFFTTKARGRGTGLGLATVYGIVQQEGGYIDVDSTVGVGTTFNVYLPTTEESIEHPADASSLAAENGEGKIVLIAEDEKAMCRLIDRVLTSKGYVVHTAQSGEEAIDVFERCDGNIHLLVTDLVMPGMSGQELAERLQIRSPSMATLYMSGYSKDLLIGPDAIEDHSVYIQKPFGPEELLRKIGAALKAEPVPS